LQRIPISFVKLFFRKLSGRPAAYSNQDEFDEIAHFLAKSGLEKSRCTEETKAEDNYLIT
jgi:hypothetical protein